MTSSNRTRRRRSLALLTASVVAAVACGAVDDPPRATVPEETLLQKYLRHASFRREELEASLVSKTNGYSMLRLAHYDTGKPGDWSQLDAWNPKAQPVLVVGPSWKAPLGAEARALSIDAAAANGDEAALRALGAEAFFNYPIQKLDVPEAIEQDDSVANYGFWRDGLRGIGGLVRAPLADGTIGVFYTCATCHAQPDEAGVLSVGRPNATINPVQFGRDPRGVVPVTDDSPPASARPADLRAVRFEKQLQTDGTVEQRNIVSLAIRIETLIITNRHELLRPPREIAAGLAVYLWSLGDAAPHRATLTAEEQRGLATFAKECAGCHAPPDFTGPPAPIADIGLTPMGTSDERGTGYYRVPSLHFVSTRGPLLHDAEIPSLEVLLDPARLSDAHGLPNRRHQFGLGLDAPSRADLVAYLRTL